LAGPLENPTVEPFEISSTVTSGISQIPLKRLTWFNTGGRYSNF
jgi:hypothetical protein